MEYIIAAGLLQVFITILFLVASGQKSVANYLLVILLCCVGWHMGTKLYIFTTVNNPAVIFRMHTFIQLAYGPLMYMYVRKKSDLTFVPAQMWYLFVPVIMITTLYAIVALVLWQYPEYSGRILSIYNAVVFVPILLSHAGFSYFMPVKAFKDTNGNDCRLAQSFRWLLAAIAVTEVSLMVFGDINPAVNPHVRSLLYIVLSLVPIAILGFTFVWHNPAQVRQNTVILEEAVTAKVPQQLNEPKERDLLLTTAQHEDLFAQLEVFMHAHAPYKDEALSLEKLAVLTGFNRHHISETLNVFAGQPFYAYINNYRITAVIQKLQTRQDKTRLLAIAFDCGFKTKASFNQYFKKIMGTTPSGYLKEKAA
jgi:AraC-like DNA-binding protein